ncbi:post-transcriptional regulator [Chengkuizengella marina]|nr:post-transcriptional regulator [Chengkuizengella marina]
MDRKLWEAEDEGNFIIEDDLSEQSNSFQSEIKEDSYNKNKVHELDENELSQTIEELCLSKAEEFRMIGYDHVTGHEIWECISNKYKKEGIPNLHKIVNDILTLKVTHFMNWLTMNAYKDVR